MTSRDFKSFLRIVAIILITSIAADRLVYYSLNSISDKVYTGQGIGKLNHYFKIKDSLELVVFGSSRANRHFVIKELSDNGFNVGVDGRKIAYPATLVELLPLHKKQTVIFNVDISYMIDSTYHGEDVDALMTYYNRNKIIKSNIDYLGQNNHFQRLYSTIGYNGYVVSILYNFLYPKYDYNKYDGYDPNFINSKQQENLMKLISSSKTKNCEEKLQINSVTVDSFSKIEKFCKENGKRLIFIASPVYRDYCKNDNLLVKRFMQEKGYIYYDYTDFFGENSNLTYWKDMEHLSDNGAQIFSRNLAKDLNLTVAKK